MWENLSTKKKMHKHDRQNEMANELLNLIPGELLELKWVHVTMLHVKQNYENPSIKLHSLELRYMLNFKWANVSHSYIDIIVYLHYVDKIKSSTEKLRRYKLTFIVFFSK